MTREAALQQELELLQVDLDSLSRRVESMEVYMRLQAKSVEDMVTTLKAIINKECSGKNHPMYDGGTT